MLRGGYQIIDLKGQSLSANAITISGVYEQIEGNYQKPLLLSGINMDGIDRADVFVTAIVDGGNYTFSAYGGTITITADDAVTFTK